MHVVQACICSILLILRVQILAVLGNSGLIPGIHFSDFAILLIQKLLIVSVCMHMSAYSPLLCHARSDMVFYISKSERICYTYPLLRYEADRHTTAASPYYVSV